MTVFLLAVKNGALMPTESDSSLPKNTEHVTLESTIMTPLKIEEEKNFNKRSIIIERPDATIIFHDPNYESAKIIIKEHIETETIPYDFNATTDNLEEIINARQRTTSNYTEVDRMIDEIIDRESTNRYDYY